MICDQVAYLKKKKLNFTCHKNNLFTDRVFCYIYSSWIPTNTHFSVSQFLLSPIHIMLSVLN